ncbi:hypothetical protein Pla52o_02530 [Novipirellula galeiformis]|uniref:RNA polymerase sigma factor n=1 Tax=Novipirellula galeiformis TaxID=2528004 RepID=A0A5C6CPD7_9BACT|nr:hypothetical protein [Novipirellula galeiformis]TWU26400.1 hypothetical protein Pla52o_02530 [Novipirellula galeiformis]
MSQDTPAANQRTTSVNLVRSSNPWTQANSAAGFVLRYLVIVRRQLVTVLGSPQHADECLKLLIAHLVSVGFGEHKKGKLRDFLIRAIRSTAKARLAELPEEQRSAVGIESIMNNNEKWLSLWRTGLLERAWRSLEQLEHKKPELPMYSVLHCATTKSKQPSQTLSQRIKLEKGIEIDEARIREVLPEARAMFAQLLADEVAETLEKPTAQEVKIELQTLGLTKAFDGIVI